MYARVVSQCSREYHCFRDVRTFNLDEYAGISPQHPASYRSYMQRHLFQYVDIDPGNIDIPDGRNLDEEAVSAECTRYESAIRQSGGIDLMFLGLGRNGHIGFNEPGSPFDSRTRLVSLTESTRKANEADFSGESVPAQAITMGIGTILDSTAIVLLATGEKKQDALRTLASAVASVEFPASALLSHPDVTVIADEPAGQMLDRG